MLDSVHLARWLQIFVDDGIDFFLFPSSPHRRLHTEIVGLLRGKTKSSFYSLPMLRIIGVPLWAMDQLFGNRLRAQLLLRLVRKWNPAVIHAVELQQAGYIALEALRRIPIEQRPYLISTNYGSDLFWFSRFASHRSKLIRLLSISDAYSCECVRDQIIAKNLGFVNRLLPVFPNFGGFDEKALSFPVSVQDSRSKIAIKGYDGWVGRATLALKALELVAPQIQGLSVEVYSANLKTRLSALRLSKRSGIEIRCYRKHQLNQNEMLALFARSAIYVGISESDGISTSLLEAMLCGAIPVQTSSSCCNEWFQESGVSIQELRPEVIAEGILQALELVKDSDSRAKNRREVMTRASRSSLAEKARSFYQLEHA